MEERMQMMGVVLFAFMIPLLAIFSPHSITSVFILLSIHPAVLFIKQGKLLNVWDDSDVNKIIIIFLAYSLISSLWAIDPYGTIYLWVRVVGFFLGILGLFAYVIPIEDKEKILKSLLYGIIFALITLNIEIFTKGYISMLLGFAYKTDHNFVPFIFNSSSVIISVISWAAISYLAGLRKIKSSVALFVAVFITIARLENFSAVIGFFLGGAFVFPVIYYQGRKAIKFFATFAVLAVCTISAITVIIDTNKLLDNKAPVMSGIASDARFISDHSVKQVLKESLFGLGFNSSYTYQTKASDYEQAGRSSLPLYLQNGPIQIWLELGAVGLGMFAAFIYLVLMRIEKTAHDNYMMAGCIALFANYFLIYQASYNIWQSWLVSSGLLAVTFLKIAMDYTIHSDAKHRL